MKVNFKALISFIFMIAISVLFMLFLDGPGGSYLLISILSALIISFLVFLWSKKTISANVELSEDILNKGDILKITVQLRKKGFLPTSFIRFSFSSSVHFNSEGRKIYSTIIFAQDSYFVEESITAAFFGNGNAGVTDMVISDYLGIFSYSLNDPSLYKTIKIYPDIPEVSGRDNFSEERSIFGKISE